MRLGGGCEGLFMLVISRTIIEAPMIVPFAFRIGDTVRDTSSNVPSLRRRMVSGSARQNVRSTFGKIKKKFHKSSPQFLWTILFISS